ncbi:head-tail joining protein [Citrobacter sp. Cf145]|nr:head-tail joining protein [Citrobacter sp. Cf145]MDM3073893.1 head-tail joining protein [Citrobacter sp. Cf145]
MRALLKPVVARELGIVLLKPGSELMSLFSCERVLVESQPAGMERLPAGRVVTQTARTGSIGVMMAHSNYGAALKTSGVEVTLIYSGDHKVDGNPYEKLPKEVRADFQARIRVEGTSPSLFVKSATIGQLARLDTLDINGKPFWVDRIGPDDCGSCHIWLGTGSPPAATRRR